MKALALLLAAATLVGCGPQEAAELELELHQVDAGVVRSCAGVACGKGFVCSKTGPDLCVSEVRS